MLTRRQARDLLADLVGTLGAPPPGSVHDQTRKIPRPALITQNWGKHDLQAGTLPSLPHQDSATLHEFFAGFACDYLTEDGERFTHAFNTVRDNLQIGAADYPMLLPSRKGPTVHTLEDATYAIGIILWCAYAMGYQLAYGEKWALVICGEHVIGVENNRIVCGYPEFCVPIAEQDWCQFFESPREPGGNEPRELYSLYKRSRTQSLEDYRHLMQAVMVLNWAGKTQHDALISSFFYEGEACSLEEFIELKVIDSGTPIKTLGDAVVPTYTSRHNFNTLVRNHRFDEPFWTTEECRAFVRSILDQLAITKNKKGKPHANSNHRKGPRG